MANYKVGDIIKMTRKAHGLSQEELSFEICSVETLSRIENGKHNVKKETYERLMARMERISDKNYAICTSDDMELLEEKKFLEDCILKYDYERADDFCKLLEKKVSNSVLNKQYIENTRALIDYSNNKIEAEELISRLEKALKLTISDYRKYIDVIYPYTEQEYVILMRLANSYNKMERYEESIQIHKMLLRSLEAGYMEGENIEYLKIVLMRNYSFVLACLDEYGKALEVLEKVLDLSKKYNYGYVMPIVLNDIAWLKIKFYENGDTSIDLDEVKKIKRQAYYIAMARNDYKIKDIIKKTYEEKFHEQIEI